jgi:hypothetical protein
MSYDFQTTFGRDSFARYPERWQTDDWALYCDAIGAFAEYLYVLVNDSGPDDGTADFLPGWGALYDPTNEDCDLFYLAQFVGVQLTGLESRDQAQALVLAEAGQSRGTLTAIRSAVQRNLTAPTNLVGNGGFEHDATSSTPAWWAGLWYGSGTSITTETTYAVETGWADTGSQSLRLTGTVGSGAGDPDLGIISPEIPATPGQAYSMTAEVDSLTSGTVASCIIYFYDAAGDLLASHDSNHKTGTGTDSLQVTDVIAPAATSYAKVICRIYATSPGSIDAYFDSIIFAPSSSSPSYFDGDTTNYAWTGTPGDSTSVGDVASMYNVIERSSATSVGTDAYQFVVIVNPAAIAAGTDQLAVDVNAVKPAGVFWTLVQSAAYVWAEAENTWTEDTQTWAQASVVQP